MISRENDLQAALRENEQRYRALFEAINEGYCVIEMRMVPGQPLDFDFIEANKAFEMLPTLGAPPGQWLHQLRPNHETSWLEICREVALTGKPARFEHIERVLGGRWFVLHAFPVGSAQQRRVGILFFDITERKRAEEELEKSKTAAEKASRVKSEFLANMSHEIRTPMTVFMAAIEHLLEMDDNPEHRLLLGMADQSAQRLCRLIDDILDFSRIEARRVKIDEENFNLRACIDGAVDLFALPAREKSLRLDMDVSPDLPERVVGDPQKLRQVLTNLIGNAVKFTRTGEIRIGVKACGELLEFAIADTGIGIPKEKCNLLFQSFSQVDSSFTREFGGAGLGLAISKGLVELMGGHLNVQSREGKGSVFTFTWPLKISEQKNLEAPADTIGKESTAARILLAEDEPMLRDLFTMVLAQRGLQIETAESGRDTLEKWAAGNFNIILMDLQMPEMNGLEATQAIRQREAQGGKRTTIIGLTGHVRREIREECLASGMDHVLTKPVQIKDLLSAIDARLSL
jgi:signal transduction histidine kinase/ActR/RegA family two-component response regulator